MNIFLIKKTSGAAAGIRTRVVSLEGSSANRYTTAAIPHKSLFAYKVFWSHGNCIISIFLTQSSQKCYLLHFREPDFRTRNFHVIQEPTTNITSTIPTCTTCISWNDSLLNLYADSATIFTVSANKILSK